MNAPNGYKVNLTIPGSITLSSEAKHGSSILFEPEYSLYNIFTLDGNAYRIFAYRIGGNISELSADKFSGVYSGTFTVTAIVEPQ